jgi:hypothetical protein
LVIIQRMPAVSATRLLPGRRPAEEGFPMASAPIFSCSGPNATPAGNDAAPVLTYSVAPHRCVPAPWSGRLGRP